jgi:hypothetical protein
MDLPKVLLKEFRKEPIKSTASPNCVLKEGSTDGSAKDPAEGSPEGAEEIDDRPKQRLDGPSEGRAN